MAIITNESPPSQSLPAVVPSSRSGSSLQLIAFAYYIQNHPEPLGLLQYDKIEITKDICALVNGERPADVKLLSALQLAASRVNTAVADLLSRNESISALTIQKIDEIHATGVLYQALRNKNLIPGEPSSNVEVQRAAITAVDVAQVTALDLSKKELRCVPEKISRFTDLQELKLYENQLTALPPGIFDNLTALTYLNLSHNQLSSLPPGIFDNLTDLRILVLDNNQITALPPRIFDNLTALQMLNLSHNQLSSLLPKIFDSLTALRALCLTRNTLERLPSRIFDKLTVLQHLFLTDNQLSSLPPEIFDNLTALVQLNLDYNQLTNLPDNLFNFGNLTALQDLNLSYNQLISLPSTLLGRLATLSRLILDGNQSLPSDIIVETDQIYAMRILYQALRIQGLIRGEPSFNAGDQRAAVAAVDVVQVRGLDLSSKGLRCVPREISWFRDLRYLDLSHNQIRYLPAEILDNLTALQMVRLQDNPIEERPLLPSRVGVRF